MSESERRMLCFSESVDEQTGGPYEADDTWDDEAFEQKISKIIRNYDRPVRDEGTSDDYHAWWVAIRRMRGLDNYLGVMVSRARLRPRGDLFRLIGWGVAVGAVLVIIAFLLAELQGR